MKHPLTVNRTRVARPRLLLAALGLCASLCTSQRIASAATPSAAPAVAATAHAIVTVPAGAAVPTALVSQVAGWKSSGRVSHVTWLDSTQSKDPGFTALLVLDFPDEAALSRWRQEQGQALGAPLTVRQVDAVVHGARPDADARQAVYEVNVYGLTTTAAAYREFCEGYITPLMQGQLQPGLLSGYTMYVERSHDGTQRSLLVKQYRDAAAYARLGDFKRDLRQRLTEKDATYARYHQVKDTLRVNVSETTAKWREP